MEERVPSAEDDPPLPIEPPPGHLSETYVVQVPKDQIYRVPPPENALIAERYRRNPAIKKRPCCSRLLWVFIILVILTLTLGVILGALYLYFSPKSPEFSISRVVVKNPQSSHQKRSHPRYEISLKAKNPNDKLGINYEGGGGAFLSFKQKKIAAGKFPALDQEDKVLTTVKMILAGSNAVPPREIERSLKDKKSKARVSLGLTMNIPVKMKIGIIKTWSMDMAVACNFRVSTLAKGTRVLSQKCHTKVQP